MANFNRIIAVQVDTVRVQPELIPLPEGGFLAKDGLEAEFRVSRNLAASPNTGEITIYNLSPETRGKLEKLPKGARVSCEAGYATVGLNEIFRGDLQFCSSRRESNGDIVTSISATDGGGAQFKRFYKSYAAGTRLQTVIEELVKASGFDTGNMADTFRRYDGLARITIPSGIVVTGSAYGQLQKLLNGNGWATSIQSNQVQIRVTDEPVAGEAFLLSPETGLLGSPSIDNKGIVSFQSEILPDLFPGRQVKIQGAAAVNGVVDVREAEYVASMRADFVINGKGKIR